MWKKIFSLSILISIIQVSPAWGRCFDEACVERKWNAFLVLLPLLIWGGIFWFRETEFSNADLRGYGERFPNAKRIKSRITLIVTLCLTILFMKWWINFF